MPWFTKLDAVCFAEVIMAMLVYSIIVFCRSMKNDDK